MQKKDSYNQESNYWPFYFNFEFMPPTSRSSIVNVSDIDLIDSLHISAN